MLIHQHLDIIGVIDAILVLQKRYHILLDFNAVLVEELFRRRLTGRCSLPIVAKERLMEQWIYLIQKGLH